MNARLLRRYIRRASGILDSVEDQGLNPVAVAAGRPLVSMADWTADRMEADAPDPTLVAQGIFKAVGAIAPVKPGMHWTASLASASIRMALMGVSFAMNAEVEKAGSKARGSLLASAEEHMLRAEGFLADTLPREDFAEKVA